MGSVDKIKRLCRLCLVNENVTVPIFDESRNLKQTYLKISSCLPVKVSRDDNLPKNICDGCSEKLDQFFIFWNTSANSEKQLIQWLGNNAEIKATKTESYVKQERVDFVDARNEEEQNIVEEEQTYVIQQDYQEEYFEGDEDANLSANKTNITSMETEDDDDTEPAETITKVEDSEEEEEEVQGIAESSFNVPSTSAVDQPGPSGIGKNVEAPSEGTILRYSCNVCLEEFPSKKEFLKHHFNQYGEVFGCCKCGCKYKTITDLYKHLDIHKLENVLQGNDEEEEEGEVEEIILNYENDEEVEEEEEVVMETADNSELLYILDDSQCVNEVVIEGEAQEVGGQQQESVEMIEKEKSPYTIVQLEHGYMMPSVLQPKQKNYETRQSVAAAKVQPSTSKKIYTPPKPGRLPVKRRHVVPDFSSTNYTFVSPNEEVDIPHYKCLRCEQLFINKFVFFRHVEKGKCFINSCDVCSALFSKNSEFYYHYLVEHTDRAICNFCFRTFMYEKNVKEHMLRHLDQFRHRCEECNKGFYTVREYRNHYKNRHMGIRHKCSICGRSFADEYYFKRHLATHAKAVKVVAS